jgi:uncharacterized integral membrane protein
MRKIVNTVVIVPLALVLLAFALANRRFVTVSFNPFDPNDASLALTLPLFIVIIASAMLGVLAGGIATWIGQRRHRKAARRLEAEAAQARAELAEQRRSTAFPVPAPRPAVPPLAIAQDKQHATL